jgi:predicted RNA binding protein YcfA (HicA-like mRNA interferase family)
MKQWTRDKFIKMVEKNGYHYARNNGSHSIYMNDEGKHITIPLMIEAPIAKRLIKENNLNENL